MSQSELAEQMKVTSATITRMVQRMEKAGLIERRLDDRDQRITRVYLQDSGRKILRQVEKVWHQLEFETFMGFTDQERDDIRQYLLRMRENLEKVSGVTLPEK